jgi:hypothetical protein
MTNNSRNGLGFSKICCKKIGFADRKPLAVFHHQECHRPLAVCIGIDRAKPDTCPNEGTSR